ncbi:MAG: hypothetical protein WCT18_02800 [Patescibacteria group bacterium]
MIRRTPKIKSSPIVYFQMTGGHVESLDDLEFVLQFPCRHGARAPELCELILPNDRTLRNQAGRKLRRKLRALIFNQEKSISDKEIMQQIKRVLSSHRIVSIVGARGKKKEALANQEYLGYCDCYLKVVEITKRGDFSLGHCLKRGFQKKKRR